MPTYRSNKNRPGTANRLTKCYHGPPNTYILSSPIGNLELVSCARGIHTLGQVEGITDDTFQPDISIQVQLISQLYPDNGYTYKPVQACIQWLNNYFQNPVEAKLQSPPTICFIHTKEGSFTERVWQTLAEKTKYGNTVSYAELAEVCGSAKACRKVGTAMRNNPVQLIIPCHRVIRSNGTFGDYCAGSRNSVKTWLLQMEDVIKS
ncbi:methylated-DNA--protein-cysteine methyltransferase-like [Lineus longissimus]|uniref:methylated-DNA--protein-cysteine methyltransferase-like n=1 Tax=Lineus longissimus TaxID=88925 RepID=UPI002B4F102D